jgi:radical SAM protein
MNIGTENSARKSYAGKRNYAQNPLIVYWEMTQACALACRHCRAEAVLKCHPHQLNHEESRDLLRQLAGFGDPLPHLILTGGDPLERPDLYELIDEAQSLGLQVSITPSATEALTAEAMQKLKVHGIQSLGLSLDGSNAARHEAVRGVPGCFGWTMRAAHAAAEVGLPIQMNTLVSEETADDLEAIYQVLTHLKVMRWSLFFLIAVGRGKALRELTPEAGEKLMNRIYDLAARAPFAIKTTEAPHYRRVALHRMRGLKIAPEALHRISVFNGFSIRDGHGIVFISNTGEICPAGFLPASAGNVRTSSVPDVYRYSQLFRALHNPDELKGKCGKCEYREICGGSRARAFAHTADPLESDPFCPYQPGGRGRAEDFTAAGSHGTSSRVLPSLT